MSADTQPTVPTRVLILSDTHGREYISTTSIFDLAIHCGDLTEESKISEFRSTLNLLRNVSAPIKVVIAGNHDITLEEDTFRKHLSAAGIDSADPAAIKEYGRIGEARALLRAARDEGIHYFEEGSHTIDLPNGARVSLYVNPQTPRRRSEGALGDGEAGWAFQYDPASSEGRFKPQPRADIFITHGPPEGILDYVDRHRAGCPDLFAAVSRLRPQLHCFGHIHAGWGAKLVTWRESSNNEEPSHFTAIDNNASPVLERLSFLKTGKFDSEETKVGKQKKLEQLLARGYCELEESSIGLGKQTMFVNAAVEGDDEVPIQPPIAVTLNLPKASGSGQASY